MVQDYVNRLLGLIERWGWSIGLILIASIFFVMACAAIISSPAALDPTTAPAFHVAGGLLGVVLVDELAEASHSLRDSSAVLGPSRS